MGQSRVLESALIDGQGHPLRDDLSQFAAVREADHWLKPLAVVRERLRAAVISWASGFFLTIALFFLDAGWWSILAAITGGAIGAYFYRKAKAVSATDSVERVGKVYWPVLALPLEGEWALYDLGGFFPDYAVQLDELGDPALLSALTDEFRQVSRDFQVLEPKDRKARVGEQTVFGIDTEIGSVLSRLNGCLGVAHKQVVHSKALSLSAGVIRPMAWCGRFWL